jgi:hypothetical protein
MSQMLQNDECSNRGQASLGNPWYGKASVNGEFIPWIEFVWKPSSGWNLADAYGNHKMYTISVPRGLRSFAALKGYLLGIDFPVELLPSRDKLWVKARRNLYDRYRYHDTHEPHPEGVETSIVSKGRNWSSADDQESTIPARFAVSNNHKRTVHTTDVPHQASVSLVAEGDYKWGAIGLQTESIEEKKLQWINFTWAPRGEWNVTNGFRKQHQIHVPTGVQTADLLRGYLTKVELPEEIWSSSDSAWQIVKGNLYRRYQLAETDPRYRLLSQVCGCC